MRSSLLISLHYIFVLQLLSWFEDNPSAVYSIDNIAQLGSSKYGKKIGDWFGPSTIAQVLGYDSIVISESSLTYHIK